MRRKITFLLLLGVIFLLPKGIKAASVTASMQCPSSATSGQNISCQISINSDVLVNGVLGHYSIGSGLTYVSFTPSNGFTSTYVSNNGFTISNLAGKKGSFVIGTVVLKVNKASNFSVTGLDVSDSNYNSYSPSNITKSIRIKSSNSKLAKITLSTGTLSPAFSSSVTNYSTTVNASSVTISATKGDSYQTVTGLGTKNLNYGSNKATITVTSEDGHKTTYTLNINRPDTRSNNNYLKSLSLNSGTINFNKTTSSYSVNVNQNVTSVKVTAALEDSKASFVSGYGPRDVNLKSGLNSVPIKVKAENGSERTYTINITRVDNRSSNNYLKTLSLSSGSLNFNKNTLNYNVTVKPSVTSLKVTASLEDSKASFVSGYGPRDVKLKNGTNSILIKVKAENGSERTYTINVSSTNTSISSNNALKSLTLSTGSIKFNKNTTTYDLKVNSDVQNIKINATLEDAKASFVSGYGPRNVNLNYGSNKILIKVKAENGNIKTYTIKVERPNAPSTNNSLKSLTIGGKTIKLNDKTTTYAISVENDIKKVTVKAIPADSKAKVKVYNSDLKVGKNSIKIEVTNEVGQVKTYVITVVRLSNEKLSERNDIKAITIKGHDIDFQKYTMEYDITLNDETSLDFDVQLEDENSSYVIEGNDNLANGSIVNLIVTSESGLSKKYKFNIIKETPTEKKESSYQPYLIGILSFIGGFFIAYIMYNASYKRLKRKYRDRLQELNNSGYNANPSSDNQSGNNGQYY